MIGSFRLSAEYFTGVSHGGGEGGGQEPLVEVICRNFLVAVDVVFCDWEQSCLEE